MELTELEKRELFQVEGDSQLKILDERSAVCLTGSKNFFIVLWCHILYQSYFVEIVKELYQIISNRVRIVSNTLTRLIRFIIMCPLE